MQVSHGLALNAVRGGVVAGLMIAQALAASPVGSPSRPPEKQLVVDQSGVRFRLGPFTLGRDWIVMNIIIENHRDESVHLAAISNPDTHASLRAKLSDNEGMVCAATAEPAGVETIPGPGSISAASTNSMTTLARQARTNISVDFEGCTLSRSSPLSFSGEFALATKNQQTQLVTVQFVGIEQRTTTW
jgi:hypothetical protein